MNDGTDGECVYGHRHLLVEDHDDTADVTARLLRRCGHVVVVAKNCAAELQAAKTGFDLLIADIRLPDRSGVELLTDLRRLRAVKSIATTADGMPEDIKRCLAAGFDTFILKPFNVAKLEEAIAELTMRITNDGEKLQAASASQSA